MQNNLIERVQQLARWAVKAEKGDDLTLAFDCYIRALEFIRDLLAQEKNPKLAEVFKEKASEFMHRAEQLKAAIKAQKEFSHSESSINKINKPPDNKVINKDHFDSLSDAILIEKPTIKWTDVAGLKQAKSALQEAVVIPARFPQLFTGERKPWKGILLYGPPGTGKSYLAKACASEVDCTFISVSSADLVSKWLGESEKLIKQLFQLAKERSPSIIFIDEIDSLCGQRCEGESDSNRRIKTEFLVQMQGGAGAESQGVLILGATNVPWELDPAVRRRFEKRIYIPLPDTEARMTQFKLRLGKTPNAVTESDFKEFGLASEGYSGSDIAVVVKEALMMPLRRCISARKFKHKKDPVDNSLKWIATYPSDNIGVEMTLSDVPPQMLICPDVNAEDIYSALVQTRPSVAKKDLEKYEQFTRQYGERD
ncbi:hypothetical protein FGO68_gene6957 [Halteria grandinella]|uniref:Vesicle-fusing ATPase n=1 Tax=Halteria grandinella TaxID=5974 RepID=A0A8J8T1P9_HALGN|nr:hypothetical protein FGO68_gene6957 [Halteria grandinella]